MRLLLDINVILDVIFQRPGEAASSELIATCSQQNQAWLAWHSAATLSYLIKRQQNAKAALEVHSVPDAGLRVVIFFAREAAEPIVA